MDYHTEANIRSDPFYRYYPQIDTVYLNNRCSFCKGKLDWKAIRNKILLLAVIYSQYGQCSFLLEDGKGVGEARLGQSGVAPLT